MEKQKINFQDQFLNIARKERLKVEIELVSGDTIRGHIKSFDNFCLLVEAEGTEEQLIYKHAASRIILLEPSSIQKSGG